MMKRSAGSLTSASYRDLLARNHSRSLLAANSLRKLKVRGVKQAVIGRWLVGWGDGYDERGR